MSSYFEVPLFGLTSDSLTNRKSINLDLNKLIPQDVRELQLTATAKFSTTQNSFKFHTSTLKFNSDAAAAAQRAPIVYRTPSPETLTFHDLCNGQSIKINILNLAPTEFITPSVQLINNNDDEFMLFFAINTGIVFKIKLPPLKHSKNPLGSIRQELFKYKSSIFVLPNTLSIQEAASSSQDCLHAVSDLQVLSENFILTRNHQRITLWEILAGKQAVKKCSAKVKPCRQVVSTPGTPKIDQNRTAIAQASVSFISSFFKNQNQETVDEFQGVTFIDWKFANGLLYLIQSDGLIRILITDSNCQFTEKIEFNLISELSQSTSTDINVISAAKLYPEDNIIVAHFTDDNGNTQFTKVRLIQPPNCVSKTKFNILVTNPVTCGDDRRGASIADFQYNGKMNNCWILYRNADGSSSVMISDISMDHWRELDLTVIKEEENILEHLQKPNIHKNFIDTESMVYVLEECYQIECPPNLTREHLVKEITQRFCPGFDSTQAMDNNTEMNNQSKSFITSLHFPGDGFSRIDTTTIEESEKEQLAEFYQALIDHEITQNVPSSFSDTYILHKNRVGVVFEGPSISKHEDIDVLLEKWANGELSENDFLSYEVDSLTENNFIWPQGTNSIKPSLSEIHSEYIKPRLEACLKLNHLEIVCKHRIFEILRLGSTNEEDMCFLNILHATHTIFRQLETKSSSRENVNQPLNHDPNDLDLSQLVLEQDSGENAVFQNGINSLLTEKSLLEVYISNHRPRDLPSGPLDYCESASLKFIHFLIDVNKKSLARQVLTSLQATYDNLNDSINSTSKKYAEILSSIIILPEEDTADEISRRIATAVEHLNSSSLFLFDDSKTIDMAIIYRHDVIRFMTEIGLAGQIDHCIQLAFMLQVISLLEAYDHVETAGALVQIAEYTLGETESYQFEIVKNTMTELKSEKNLESSDVPALINTVYNDIVPLLHSKMFMHYLKFGDTNAAYEVAFQNPQNSQKLACLRHLICHLCENNECDKITGFQYSGCLNDVVDILLGRARASQLFISNTSEITAMRYYEVLISLLLKRSEFYKAANVQLEVARRLKNEETPKWMSFEDYLRHLEEELLPAVSFLGISEKKWLVYKSVTPDSRKFNSGLGGAQAPSKQIVTIEMLERELLRVQKLQLIGSCNPEACTRLLDADGLGNSENVVKVLCQEELYDDALDLANVEYLPFTEIARSLSCKVAQNSTQTNKKKFTVAKLSSQNSDTINLLKTPDDQKWTIFLEKIMDKIILIETEVRLAPGKAKLLYETAIKQFITNGVGSIPQWLISSYGLPASIRLFARSGRLDEAGLFAIELMKSNIEQLLQDDSINLVQSNQLEPIPWQIIDQILSRENTKNVEPSIKDELENKVNDYMDELEKLDQVLVQRGSIGGDNRMFAGL